MKFTKPPAGGFPGNYTGNHRYVIGENMDISWVEGNMGTIYNLIMFQNFNGDSETIQKGLSGEGGYSWIVGTNKNLEVSEIFYFELQVQLDDGSVKAGPKCHYFNISTAPSAAPRSSGFQSPLSSPPPTTITTSSSGGLPAEATGTREPSPAGDISTNTKIGFGMAIPITALIGMLMGWALFRSCLRRKSNVEGVSGIGLEANVVENQSEQAHDKHELPALPRRTVTWIVRSELAA